MDRPRFARRRRSVGIHATQAAPVVSVGAIERADPIPEGVYWIDSIEPAAFGADAEEVQHARELYIRRIESQHPGAYRVVRTALHDEGQYDREWILFEVKTPIPRWPPNAHWGFPTLAPNGLNTEEGDTVQRPPPEKGPLEGLGENTLGLPNWAWAVGGLAVIGVVVYAASRD